MQNQRHKPSAASKTGLHPRADLLSSTPQEPPETLPEVTEPGATTGIIPMVPEGEDTAKSHDDSAGGRHQ